jgi:hypothetical protein
MDIKELIPFLPLVGVAIGWFLNELAGTFRVAREERQGLKSALPPLLILYFEQYRINEILTFCNLRMGNDFEKNFHELKKNKADSVTIEKFLTDYMAQFEEMRKQNIALPEKNTENLSEDLSSALASLSKVAPVYAYRARKLFSEFTLFQELEMPSPSGRHSEYLQTFGLILAVFRSDMHHLKSLIKCIAFKAGLMQYVQIWWLLRKEEGELSGGTEKAHTHIFKMT